MYLITIDPGLRSTGIAIWISDAYAFDHELHPKEAMLLTSQSSMTWQEKAENIADQFDDLIFERHRTNISSAHCEMPEYYSSLKGATAASSGSLFKLCFLVGMLGGICMKQGIDFHLIRPTKWKGQLPKDVVQKRITRLLGKEKCRRFSKDIWDAVGMGLFMKGAFK